MNSKLIKWQKKICGIDQMDQRLQAEPPREDDLALPAVDLTLAGSSCLFGSNVEQALPAVGSTLAGSSYSISVTGNKRRPPKMRVCYTCQVLLPGDIFVKR